MIKKILSIVVTIALFVSLISINPAIQTYADTDAVEEESLEPALSRTKLTLKPGVHWRLKVTGNEGKVEWSSKNEEVATVSSKGYVTAVAEGTTKIYAKVDGKKLVCRLTVEAVKTVKLVAVGDNLYHQNVINSGLQEKDGTYNYDRIYENIEKYVQAADVAILNQEVLLSSDNSIWAGYPDFASPLEAGDAVVKAGFNVITCASNHSYDKGASVLLENVNYWKSKARDGVVAVGIYGNRTDYNKITVKKYNGIKIAFLNYTYGVNGHRPDSDHSYMIKFASESLIKSEIQKAKTLADVVIVLPHWGKEYQLEAGDDQKALAKKMAEWGADIIIGTHPHVVEPLKFITTSDGRKVPCYYSLGNLVGNYIDWYKPMLEGMAELTITKWKGEIKIKNAKLTPMVCDIRYNKSWGNDDDHRYGYTVYKLSDYTEEMADRHINNRDSRTYKGNFTLAGLNQLFEDIMSGNVEKYEDRK